MLDPDRKGFLIRHMLDLINTTNAPQTALGISQVLGPAIGFAGGFLTALVAEPLRQRFFAPRLRLSFGNSEDFISHTPETRDGQTGQATYLRLRVENKSFRLAKACRAYLTNVQREDETGHPHPTQYCDSIQLAWSVRVDEAYGPQDLAQGVPYFVDVVSFRDDTNIFMPHVHGLPFRYSSIFENQGTYLLTIVVSGDGVKPSKTTIRVEWRGDRKALVAGTAP
jgi:hypothetical protein